MLVNSIHRFISIVKTIDIRDSCFPFLYKMCNTQTAFPYRNWSTLNVFPLINFNLSFRLYVCIQIQILQINLPNFTVVMTIFCSKFGKRQTKNAVLHLQTYNPKHSIETNCFSFLLCRFFLSIFVRFSLRVALLKPLKLH